MRFPKVNIFGATEIFSVSRKVHEEIKNCFVRGTSATEKGGFATFPLSRISEKEFTILGHGHLRGGGGGGGGGGGVF